MKKKYYIHRLERNINFFYKNKFLRKTKKILKCTQTWLITKFK